MIEVWFELEKMKSNRIPGRDFARMSKRCEQRTHGAIIHLASATVTESIAAADRSGGSEAVRVLWMEAVALGKAETAAALAELRENMKRCEVRDHGRAAPAIGHCG